MSDVATGTKSDAVEIPSDESVDGANDLADTTGNENTTFVVIGVVLLLVVFVPGIVLCVFLHRNDCAGGGRDTGNRQPPEDDIEGEVGSQFDSPLVTFSSFIYVLPLTVPHYHMEETV